MKPKKNQRKSAKKTSSQANKASFNPKYSAVKDSGDKKSHSGRPIEQKGGSAGNEAFARVQLLEIDPDRAGQRLDNYLTSVLKGAPKTLIYRIIRKGEVRVNKGRVKPEYKLCAGDLVRIPPVRLTESSDTQKASNSLLDILRNSVIYEDASLLIIDKPAGLAVHAGSGVKVGLIEALRQLREDDRYLELIHRLDRGTSGLVMVAKKRSMLRYMQQLLREKSLRGRSGGVVKIYQALALGVWPKGAGQVDAPLLKVEQSGGECVMKIRPDGKPSKTLFKALSHHKFSDRKFTLLEARPITGRTHQIRVHAQSQGCPLLGDEKYGRDSVNELFKSEGYGRMFLHASTLRFSLPEGEQVEVSAPLPVLWQDLLKASH